jgi:hypothetical protein
MITRANLISGPARIVRNALSCHVREPFEVNIVKAQTPIVLDGYGEIDQRDEDLMISASFTPDGSWNANARSLLWPYLNPTIGADIFGSADVPTTIHDSNSHLHTIAASAITQMPSISLSASATMIGQATITGIRPTGGDWATDLYTAAASGGTFTDTAFVPADIKVQQYTGAWAGVTGFSGIETEGGWTIDFNTDIQWFKTDAVGTVTGRLRSVSVVARCTPLGISGANVASAMDMQETASRRGKSGNVLAADLTITGADASAIVVLKSAKLVRAGYRFGASVLRDGELGWVATRNFTAGVGQALCTLA